MIITCGKFIRIIFSNEKLAISEVMFVFIVLISVLFVLYNCVLIMRFFVFTVLKKNYVKGFFLFIISDVYSCSYCSDQTDSNGL